MINKTYTIPIDNAFIVTGYCISKNGFFKSKEENSTKNLILQCLDNNGSIIDDEINNLDPLVKDKYIKFGHKCFDYFKNLDSQSGFALACQNLILKRTITNFDTGVLAAMFYIYNNELLITKQTQNNSSFKEEVFQKFRLGSDHNCTIPNNFNIEEKQGAYGSYYEISFEQDNIIYKFNTTKLKLSKITAGKTIFVKIYNHKITKQGMPILVFKVLKY